MGVKLKDRSSNTVLLQFEVQDIESLSFKLISRGGFKYKIK